MPKIDIATAPATIGSGYPDPWGPDFAERVRIRLGDAAGLTAFGVNLVTLPPGTRSSLRHWHEVEDEMAFVLEGEVVLIEDEGETVLRAGEAAGWKGGVRNGHVLENRGAAPARLLEIGNRPERDRCHYSDVDLVCVDEPGRVWFERRDGTLVE